MKLWVHIFRVVFLVATCSYSVTLNATDVKQNTSALDNAVNQSVRQYHSHLKAVFAEYQPPLYHMHTLILTKGFSEAGKLSTQYRRQAYGVLEAEHTFEVFSRLTQQQRSFWALPSDVASPGFIERIELGIVTGTSFHRLFVSGELFMDVSDTDGGTAIELEAGRATAITDRLSLTPIVGIRWGSRDYIKRYFGAPDELRQQFDAFNPHGGFFEYFTEAAIEYRFAQSWSFKSSVRYAHLLGSASRSPFVERAQGSQGQVSAFTALIWLF